MTAVSEVVSGIKKGTTYFFRLIAVDINDVTAQSGIQSFIGGKPMVKITSVSPSGAAGTYGGSGMGGHVSVSVTGEGRFSSRAPLMADGTWETTFPATLATGTYGVEARLWKSVASDTDFLTVP